MNIFVICGSHRHNSEVTINLLQVLQEFCDLWLTPTQQRSYNKLPAGFNLQFTACTDTTANPDNTRLLQVLNNNDETLLVTNASNIYQLFD